MIPLVFLLATAIPAKPAPAVPAVGDPIAIEIKLDPGERLAIDPSPHFEIVTQQGGHLSVRTFEPKPFEINGKIVGAGGKTRALEPLHVAVRSVLAPDDKLQAALLVPPRPDAMPLLPLIAIGIAAIAVVAILVYLLARRRAPAASDERSSRTPAERYQDAIAALRASRAPRRWAALADATRAYLAAVAPELGADLTSRELMAALQGLSPAVQSAPVGNESGGEPPQSIALQATIAEILQQGDLEKFSPWGAMPRDFDALAVRALAIPQAFEPAPEEIAA
ncbi:MAG TPA: hypothetical protein VEZ11_02270 [Thermoanaerobaculia bacterium]|nr:hypothetical protein [Thermoanaerobaculia bacterium]